MKAPTPLVKQLVLLGGGHSHLAVLKKLGMNPVPGLAVTLISREVLTPYSGALPAHLCGQYSLAEMQIDLRPLAQFAGARLIQAEVKDIDLQSKRILLPGRPAIEFDLLSLNTGSQPNAELIPGAQEHALAIKPIDEFLAQWQQIRADIRAALENKGAGYHLLIVGGGPASVEFALAAQSRIGKDLGQTVNSTSAITISVVCAEEKILSGHNSKAQQAASNELHARGIKVITGRRINAFHAGAAEYEDGETINADAMIYATGASLAPWLGDTGLALSDDGFIAVNSYLQSTSHDFVFAAGDNATLVAAPRPKSGVYAVRQGKILAHNLIAQARGKKLRAYHPQQKALALLNLGNGEAIASRGQLFFQGRLAWQLKHRIDSAFLRKYSQLPEMSAEFDLSQGLVDRQTEQELRRHALRCAGCGAKVASDILAEVLTEMQGDGQQHKVEDAAIITLEDGRLLLQSVDYLRAFNNDPYLFARIASNHSLSDIYAMGVMPHSALALVGIPPASRKISKAVLNEIMQGCRSILDEEDCELVGGHSAESESLHFGLCVNGFSKPEAILAKNNLQKDEVLVLAKALGTGTLLAADMRYKAGHEWMQGALAEMLVSNRKASQIFVAHGASSCTDITGFGLAGHLGEMLDGRCEVELDLGNIPALDGALTCLRNGITSSLHGNNSLVSEQIETGAFTLDDPRLQLLFDPQTAGGLLASVAAERAGDCIKALQAAGYSNARAIGRVIATDQESPRIHLR